MSGIKYLLDTCFILGLYNSNQEALQGMAGVSLSECAISPINRMEVLGFELSAQDHDNLSRLLANFQRLPIDEKIENKVISLRQRHKIKLPDCIILATALTHDLQLLTLDIGLMNKYHKEINP